MRNGHFERKKLKLRIKQEYITDMFFLLLKYFEKVREKIYKYQLYIDCLSTLMLYVVMH